MEISKKRQSVLIQAEDLGWDVYREEPEQYKITFVRNEVRLDVWYSRMTVAIMQKGKPAKYHRFVSEKKFDQLLDNPLEVCRT
jgi:uncharacterized iron-regulated protein